MSLIGSCLALFCGLAGVFFLNNTELKGIRFNLYSISRAHCFSQIAPTQSNRFWVLCCAFADRSRDAPYWPLFGAMPRVNFVQLNFFVALMAPHVLVSPFCDRCFVMNRGLF